jgi:ribosome modulation factor
MDGLRSKRNSVAATRDYQDGVSGRSQTLRSTIETGRAANEEEEMAGFA